jgi:hypothetical protein
LNLKRNKTGGKGAGKTDTRNRFCAAFPADKKGDKAYQDKPLKNIPGNFNLQADKAVLAGAVMVQVDKGKGSGEKEDEDEADSKDGSFPRNSTHECTLPECCKIVKWMPLPDLLRSAS